MNNVQVSLHSLQFSENSSTEYVYSGDLHLSDDELERKLYVLCLDEYGI